MSATLSLAERVREVFDRALFTRDELAAGEHAHAVRVEGIVRSFGLHPGRLEASRAEVLALCELIVQRPFWADGGGGWTFLNLVVDVETAHLGGEPWGEHANAEQLYALAAGLGLAAFVLPRKHWGALPGAVPYIVFRRAPVAAGGPAS